MDKLSELKDRRKKLAEELNLAERQKNILDGKAEKLSKQARAERTRRLIQVGALAEKYLQLEGFSIDDISRMFRNNVQSSNLGDES